MWVYVRHIGAREQPIDRCGVRKLVGRSGASACRLGFGVEEYKQGMDVSIQSVQHAAVEAVEDELTQQSFAGRAQ